MRLIVVLIRKAVVQGTGILCGTLGEIVTEKSGNLNLGVPGIIYMGGIAGPMEAFFYENAAENPSGLAGLLVSSVCVSACAVVGGLIYSVLTITLRANQNVTGLALMTFGVGFGNFFGGSLSQLAGDVGQVSVAITGVAYNVKIPGLPKLGVIGDVFFSYGFLTYLCVILTVALEWFLTKTRKGLNLRAVGENPGTADAAGISVTRYKYLATCVGNSISGTGGPYFIMEYSGGTWINNGFSDRGWLATALVIFTLWKPVNAIWGSILSDGLYTLYLYISGLGRSTQEIFKMLPYVVTIVVLIITSFRRKWENQPSGSLGLPYFREER